MSAGTKIFLAVVALFIGTVIVYYAVIAPQNDSRVERDPVTDDDANEVQSTGGEFRNELPANGTSYQAAATNQRGDTGRASLNAADPSWKAPVPRIVPGSDVIDDGGKDSPDSIAMGPPMPADFGAAPVQANVPISAADAARDAANRGAMRPLFNPAEMSQSPGAAPTSTAASTSQSLTAYSVRPGDTLVYIAEDWFGDEHKWDLILAANPDLKNPNRLQVGQKINLPPKNTLRAAPAPAESRPAAAQTGGYTVASGDTLTVIAQKHYGQSSAWKVIYDANRQAIGENPNRLKVGMKLTIPPRSGAR